MSKGQDRDEVKVILDLYKKDKVSLEQALNLLGYNRSVYHNDDLTDGVVWPTIKVKKPLFDQRELNDGGC